MEKAKLDRVYDIIINSKTIITERTFLINGISNSKEVITLLQNNGTLKMVEPGKYQISSVEELYNYGLRLLKSNYQLRANLCFEKCYQINPNHRNTSLQILLLAIKAQNYQKAYDIIDNISEIEPEKYQYDNNLYLYLLNILEKCPEKYADKVKTMTLKSIMPKSNMSEEEIEMRKEIINNHFIHSIYFLNNIGAKNLEYSIERKILKELLSKVVDSESTLKQQLDKLTDNHQYQEIVSTLEEIEQQRKLNTYNRAIYILSKKIIEISKTRTIPKVTIEQTDLFEQALLGNNFSLANDLNNKLIVKTKKKPNTIDKLLLELNKIIKEIKESELSISREIEESSIPRITTTEETFYQQSEDEYKELERMEDLAYYLKETKLPFNMSCKKIGLLPEQVLLIKLIYAKDYYIEGNFDAGDQIIKEVELSFNISTKVIYYLNKVKKNRNNYQKETATNTRKLIIRNN